MARTHPTWLQFAAVVGVALLVFGCVSAVRGWPVLATAVGVGGGLLCLVFVIFHEKITQMTVSVGNAQLDIALKPSTAAEFVKTGLAGLGSTYAFVHNQLADDPQSQQVKIRLQDEMVKIAQSNAFDTPVDGAEIDRILADGSAGERVLAFGLLTSNPHLATLPRLLAGISESRTGNEQYHALKAVEASWATLDDEAHRALTDAIRGSRWIREDADRREVAERILGLPARA